MAAALQTAMRRALRNYRTAREKQLASAIWTEGLHRAELMQDVVTQITDGRLLWMLLFALCQTSSVELVRYMTKEIQGLVGLTQQLDVIAMGQLERLQISRDAKDYALVCTQLTSAKQYTAHSVITELIRLANIVKI